jgi:hypothetical protein
MAPTHATKAGIRYRYYVSRPCLHGETKTTKVGSVTRVPAADIALTRYGVGDVIFFRQGAHAKWHVEDYVKKIAFCRQTNPIGLGFVIRAVNKLKRLLSKQPQAKLWGGAFVKVYLTAQSGYFFARFIK